MTDNRPGAAPKRRPGAIRQDVKDEEAEEDRVRSEGDAVTDRRQEGGEGYGCKEADGQAPEEISLGAW